MSKRSIGFFFVAILAWVALLGLISYQAQLFDLARQENAQQAEEIALLQQAKHGLATKYHETDRWAKAQVGRLRESEAMVESLKGRVAESQEAAMAYTCAIRNLLRAEQMVNNLFEQPINPAVDNPIMRFEAAISQTNEFRRFKPNRKWPLAIPMISPGLRTLAETHGYRFRLLGDDIYEVIPPKK